MLVPLVLMPMVLVLVGGPWLLHVIAKNLPNWTSNLYTQQYAWRTLCKLIKNRKKSPTSCTLTPLNHYLYSAFGCQFSFSFSSLSNIPYKTNIMNTKTIFKLSRLAGFQVWGFGFEGFGPRASGLWVRGLKGQRVQSPVFSCRLAKQSLHTPLD